MRRTRYDGKQVAGGQGRARWIAQLRDARFKTRKIPHARSKTRDLLRNGKPKFRATDSGTLHFLGQDMIEIGFRRGKMLCPMEHAIERSAFQNAQSTTCPF